MKKQKINKTIFSNVTMKKRTLNLFLIVSIMLVLTLLFLVAAVTINLNQFSTGTTNVTTEYSNDYINEEFIYINKEFI